jgi:hypothetical protein
VDYIHLAQWRVGVLVKVILLPTVSRPVCPGVRPPSGIRDQFFFLLLGNYLQTSVVYLVRGALFDERMSAI